jgi:uridine kinase
MAKALNRPRIIAVSGGSGSGKTTLVQRLVAATGAGGIMVVHMDNYYQDLVHLSQEERDLRNFDHPEAFDTQLLQAHIQALHAGQSIERPTYDFASHTRLGAPVTLAPAPVIVLDGILSLHWPALRGLLDLGIFVDVSDDVRFIRRLQRDVSERGRTVDSVVAQYLATVKAMHDLYVAPQKYVADIIVSWEDYNDRAVAMLAGMVRSWTA